MSISSGSSSSSATSAWNELEIVYKMILVYIFWSIAMAESIVSDRQRGKIINFDEYLRKKAILGILARKDLSEAIKEYPRTTPVMYISVNNIKDSPCSADLPDDELEK